MHAADWGDFHYRITGKDSQGNLKLEGGWQNNRPYGLSEQNRMVETSSRNSIHRANGITTGRLRYFITTRCLARIQVIVLSRLPA